MASATAIDYPRLARELEIDPDAIARTVALLDDGNTVPFITRYRRDQTGGLDEEQIGRIRDSVTKLRQLDERKQTILRSIESQHKLTDELRREIERADSVKRLEDLYLPFRPKKQTLATKAREQGLGPLADEILAGAKQWPISTPAPPTSSTPIKACPTPRSRCWARATFWPSSSAKSRAAAEGPQDVSQERQAGQHEGRRQRKEEPAVSRLPRFPRAAPPHSAASRAGDQSRRAGQGAAREDRSRRAPRSSSWRSSCSCRPSIRTRIF